MSDLLATVPAGSQLGILLMIVLGAWALYDVFIAKDSWLYPDDEGDNDGTA